MICPRCFGASLIPTHLEFSVEWGPVLGPLKPCDYPGCLNGFVDCCDPPVNRFELGFSTELQGRTILDRVRGVGKPEVPDPLPISGDAV